MYSYRSESPGGILGVWRVNELAFGRPNEALIVDALRAEARPTISLVAVDGELIVGHIFSSPVSVVSSESEFARA